MRAELNLNDPRGSALARLILAQRDIREAKSFAHLVVTRIRLPNDGFFRPLSYASTIAYSRPFTGSKGYPKLPPGYSTFDRPDFDALHQQIICIRHKCVAHSDAELNRVVLLLGNGAPLQTPRHAIRSRQLAFGTFALFRDLCEYQLNRLKKDIATQFTGTASPCP
jgi:hypothetical protein